MSDADLKATGIAIRCYALKIQLIASERTSIAPIVRSDDVSADSRD
jgi:hypothetical protein